jgi:hypothetical protein
MDHILIYRRRHSSILAVRSFRAADCDTDHCLLVSKVMERLAVSKGTTTKCVTVQIFGNDYNKSDSDPGGN